MKEHLLKPESLIILCGYGALFLIGAWASLFNVDLMRLLDQMPQTCLFKILTGYQCAGCGLTHAFLSLSQFKVGAAFHYHPFSPFLFAGGIIWLFTKDRQHYLPRGIVLFFVILLVCVFWVTRNLGV